MLTDLLPLLQTTLLSFFAEDPAFRLMQGGLLTVGMLDVFLLFWTLRDVLGRSESLVFQMFSLLLVFTLPFLGFFVYLLIRPSSTLRERAVTAMIEVVLDAHHKKMMLKEKKNDLIAKKSSSHPKGPLRGQLSSS